MAEKTKAELESDLKATLAHLNALRTPFIKANLITEDSPPEALIKLVVKMLEELAASAAFVDNLEHSLRNAAVITGEVAPAEILTQVGVLLERDAKHAAELRERDAIIAELRASPPVLVDAESGKLTLLTTEADDIPEDQIRDKVRAGLDRKTAIQVIRRQRAEDAANDSRAGKSAHAPAA